MNKQYLIDLIFKTQVGSMSVSKASQLISEAFDSKDNELELINTEWHEAIERNIHYCATLEKIKLIGDKQIVEIINKAMRDVK